MTEHTELIERALGSGDINAAYNLLRWLEAPSERDLELLAEAAAQLSNSQRHLEAADLYEVAYGVLPDDCDLIYFLG